MDRADEPIGWNRDAAGEGSTASPASEPPGRKRGSAVGRLARRFGIGVAVVAAIVAAGAFFGGETSTASWSAGNCVSAKDSTEVAAVGDAMVAVHCDEPNEGRILGEAAGEADCPPATDYYVARERGGEVFCIAE